MQLFFSYARPDRPRVDILVTRLRQAGIEVWLDSDLIGGWPWWDKILGQLRSCDAVLAVVSRASLGSQACRAERSYAIQLGKPVLPLALERVPSALFPADIAPIQVIDYTQPDEDAAFRLASAIYALPAAKPLPSPLPEPPAIPGTRFGDLNDRIAEPSLTLTRQLGLVGLLEAALAPTSDPDDRLTALEMLREMAKRRDLYAAAARKIEALLAQEDGPAREPDPPPAGTARPDEPERAGALSAPAEPARAETAPAPAPAEPALAEPAPAEPAPAEPAPAEPPKVPWWLAGQPEAPPPPSQPALSEPAHSPPASSPEASSPEASPAPASSGTPVNTHHRLAVISAVLTYPLVIFAPIGIVALRCSSRATARLAAQDLAGAREASSRVVLAFWAAIGIWVVAVAAIFS